jgi:vacuole morphology and inheritance protein 14
MCVDRMVKDLVMINDYSQIKQVVSVLVHDFTLSSSANTRKGGLVGLAATAIALGRVSLWGGGPLPRYLPITPGTFN